MRRHAAAAALLGLLFLLLPYPAAADLSGARPEDGAVLDTFPDVLELDFLVAAVEISEAVLSDLGTGAQYMLSAALSEDGSTAVLVSPEAPGAGRFVISWRAVLTDGTVTSGETRFEVSAATDGSPTLASSFPRPDRELVFPPREARISFSSPFDTSGFAARLTTLPDGGEEALQRLSSGFAADVLMRVPVLGAGEYRIDWTLTLPSGEVLEGAVPFSVAPPLVAAGGGNHRHSTDDLFIESLSSWLPRAALLLLAGLLMGVWRRSRGAGEGFSDVLSVRVLGAAMGVFALVGVAVSAVEGLVRSGDHPLFAVLASDAVWVYLAATALGVLLGLVGRPGVPLALSSLTLAALVWSVGPAMQFRYGPAVPLLSLLLYGLTFLFASELPSVARAGYPRWRPVVLLWGVAAVSSALLFATAQTFQLLGSFASEWVVRLPATVVVLAVSLLWLRVRSVRGPLSLIMLMMMALGAAFGLWAPPPAPGL